MSNLLANQLPQKNSQRAGFWRNTGHILDIDTLDITSSYLTIQKAPQKPEITREPTRKKHSSVLLRFTFNIHRNLFYMDYICFVVISSCQMVGQGMLTFIPSNLVSSNLLRPQHVYLENPPLSYQADCASLSQGSRAARSGCQGWLTPQWLPFWEAAHSGSLTAGASSTPVLTKDVSEALG